MFLYDCIGVVISNLSNNLIDLLYKCNYYINNTQIIRCLDKEYMYDKYCNISLETCDCIQNSILYNNSIYNKNYNVFFVCLLFSMTFMLCCCKKKRFIIINSSNISLLDDNDTPQNIIDIESIDIDNNNYVIDKNDTLPKYNIIDNEIDNVNNNTTQLTIVEILPPKYNEINEID